MKRIIVKVGTKVLTNSDGVLERSALSRIVVQLAQLKQAGHEVALVSSGAMGAGKGILKTTKQLTDISEKQLYAAIGQVHLINEYAGLFDKYDLLCAQVLATKEDFRDRSHFLNMRNCLDTLLHDSVIPIINENDVVALSELTFTDNDELAGLVASMLNADTLLILSSIDGMMDTAKNVVIPRVGLDDYSKYHIFVTPDKSEAGRGGMVTKFEVARKLTKEGVEVIIANGTKDNTILEAVNGQAVGTHFIPGKKLSNIQRRLAHSEMLVRGRVHINECAVDVVHDNASAASLLPVGVTRIEGEFEKKDVIEIVGPDGNKLGYGIVQYNADEARGYIGKKNMKPLIHYDYMFIG